MSGRGRSGRTGRGRFAGRGRGWFRRGWSFKNNNKKSILIQQTRKSTSFTHIHLEDNIMLHMQAWKKW